MLQFEEDARDGFCLRYYGEDAGVISDLLRAGWSDDQAVSAAQPMPRTVDDGVVVSFISGSESVCRAAADALAEQVGLEIV